MSVPAYPTRRRLRSRYFPGLCGAALLSSILLAVLALASCGSSLHAGDAHATTASAAVSSAPPECASALAQAYGQVAAHVYREFAQGRVVEPAVHRLQGSPALIAAVQSGDAAATSAALEPLIRGQLARVRVIVKGRTLAEYGSGEALAPVSAPLRDASGSTVGTLVASEQDVRGYVGTVSSFVAGEVLVRAGSQQLAGTTLKAPASLPDAGTTSFGGKRYAVYSLPGTRFPSGSLRTYVLTPYPRASACARTRAATVADAIGGAAVEIYREEQSGTRPLAAVRDFERSRSFQEAVAANDPVATQAAIVAFFKTQLHVVRVRATLGGRLVTDLGGPHVLAPVGGKVRDASGHVVGHFLLSIQDDLGYRILAHRFTGALVLLRRGSRQITGDLSPGPLTVPDRGAVVYRGVRYQAYSFQAQAFPQGPLRVSLLIPPS